MKTISELKAEIGKFEKQLHDKRKDVVLTKHDRDYVNSQLEYNIAKIKGEIARSEAIRTEIETQVGKCENKIHEHDTTGSIIGFKYCRNVPNEQKCPGCRALLGLEAKL